MLKRWMPFAVATAFAAVILIRAGTAPVDLFRYAAYVALTVVLPGTLVYRALRRAPHTLVEDLAMGAAVGLALEVGAWAAFSALDLRSWLWAWPVAVVAPFAAVPRLRRHWWVRDYAATPTLAWSWAVAGVVGFFTAYLAMVFLDRNPILPTSEQTRQYIDLSYQLSLAGEAKHNFPVDLPQVAGEPLYYHWFGHAHMAATSLIGGIDLTVVALRLAIPALSALAILLTAVVGWRISGRPLVGAVAAALFFVVGEFNFTDPVTMPFGTQATFVVWHGMSMIYSWVLLLALIACLGAIVASRAPGHARAKASANVVAPVMGRGAFALATLLLVASSGAKASTLPVVGIALAVTAVARLISERRIPWRVVVIGLITGAVQLFAMGVLFRFQTYGVAFGPLQGLRPYWSIDPASGWPQWMVAVGVWIAFMLNLLLRLAGIVALVWVKRFRLEPVQWFLLGGALGGPALYLLFSQPGSGNQYFTRAGFAFGVILSAWGYALVLDRARLSQRARLWLGSGAVLFAAALVWIQLAKASTPSGRSAYRPLEPLLTWAAVLALNGLGVSLCWLAARRRWRGLRGRGPVVALTAVLVAGVPGLIMDEVKSIRAPNGGPYVNIALPQSRVDAARWVRDHSEPDDIVATNVHCIGFYGDLCDSRSFWLSAYGERSVLVEGWAFSPRLATIGLSPFWDQKKLRLNDEAFRAPTADGLRELHDRHGVRWLVVDRSVAPEPPTLRTLADLRYDNGRLAVYEVRG